jgi:lathosterol oxidase
MDIALDLLDTFFLDRTYAWALPHPGVGRNSSLDVNLRLDPNPASTSLWARDNVYRQSISILLITQIGATFLYLGLSALSYYLIFDRRLEHHPRFLKNQVLQEIQSSLAAIPFITVLTLPWFLAEVRGYSLLYSDISTYGWTWFIVSFFLYMTFNDVAIYWIHRLEHHPRVYKHIHKPHHKWIGTVAVPAI